MAKPLGECPYVGLQPFRESDASFFFGRGREARVISANLQFEPITVLYGASGVGKSSVLQAGALPLLKSAGNSVPVHYFRDWQKRGDVLKLLELLNRAVDADTEDGAFFVLDQFEEFILYYDRKDVGGEVDSALARLVNRDEGQSKLLIGIREDSLSALDQRLGLRIPRLLTNTLQIQHLNKEGAREAIIKPLEAFAALTGEQYTIERGLVDEILTRSQATPSASNAAGLGRAKALEQGFRVETVYLQLVLKRLWNQEVELKSKVLRLETLKAIGGASKIIDSHVENVMRALTSESERAIAARLFPHLVTPSGRKIAQETSDLLNWGAAPEDQVRDVLKSLSERSETRILRRIAAPEMFELFHDVLAKPVLDWNKRRCAAIERQAAIKKWSLSIGLLFLLAISAALGYGWYQNLKAKNQADIARLQAEYAEKSRQAGLKLSSKVQASNPEVITILEQEALKAEKIKNYTAAQALRHAEELLKSTTEQSREVATQLSNPAPTLDEGESLSSQLEAKQNELSQVRTTDQALRQQVADLTSRNTKLNSDLDMANAKINKPPVPDETPALREQIATLKSQRDDLKDQLDTANEKLKAAGQTRAVLEPALKAYENVFTRAFAKNANCKDVLKNGPFKDKTKELQQFQSWCGSAKAFKVLEDCDPDVAGSSDFPSLTCTEAEIIEPKDGQPFGAFVKKIFEFERGQDGRWRVTGWR